METENLVKFITELTEKYPEKEIYIDLQGSKIRISRDQPQFILKKDQKIKLTIEEPTPDTKSIHIGNPNTIKLLSKGTHVKIDDGRIELIIDSVENEKIANATVIKEGTLRPGKGFNLYPHPFVQNQLNKRDLEIVEKLKNFKNIKFALSFVSVPEEILDLKKRSNNKFVAAKIEREMTQEQVKAICNVCDCVWICRGDMGVQMGFVGMAKFVREFTNKYIPNLKVPCIIAGEVMEHFC
jgi:pyruvate kinase